MDDPMKIRYELIRIYAALDPEYQRLLREAEEADLLLKQWERELPQEVLEIFRSAIRVHEAAAQHMTLLACRHLIIRSERELP